MTLESKFQHDLIGDLEELFPGCIVIKNDPNYLQGIPDLSIFLESRWAMLEVKTTIDAYRGPNQKYYIDLFNKMSFAAFICPENKDEVLRELQQALRPSRSTRLLRR